MTYKSLKSVKSLVNDNFSYKGSVKHSEGKRSLANPRDFENCLTEDGDVVHELQSNTFKGYSFSSTQK